MVNICASFGFKGRHPGVNPSPCFTKAGFVTTRRHAMPGKRPCHPGRQGQLKPTASIFRTRLPRISIENTPGFQGCGGCWAVDQPEKKMNLKAKKPEINRKLPPKKSMRTHRVFLGIPDSESG